MGVNVGKIVSELRKMTVKELRQKYAEVHGEQTRSHHKEYLIRRIAWRMQANEEGDLPERARRRALEIADDADLRMRAPGSTAGGGSRTAAPSGNTAIRPISVPADDRLPMPGAVLTRQYRGRIIQVRVLPNGFDYEGTVYRSLSAVAKAVTGAQLSRLAWSGPPQFGSSWSTRCGWKEGTVS
jgi:hypothetical protein